MAERQTSRAAGGGAFGASELSPTVVPTHYVAAWDTQGDDEDAKAAKARGPSALPAVLVITEWPAERTKAEALSLAPGACDALLFVVNPADGESMRFFAEHVHEVGVTVHECFCVSFDCRRSFVCVCV